MADFVLPLQEWFVHSALASALILLAGVGGMLLIRQPARRQRLGELALLSSLLAALLCGLPAWLPYSLPLYPAAPRPMAVSELIREKATFADFEDARCTAHPDGDESPAEHNTVVPRDHLLAAAILEPLPDSAPQCPGLGLAARRRAEGATLPWSNALAWLAIFYAVLVGALLLRFLLGCVGLWRLKRVSEPAPARAAALFAELTRGWQRPPDLRVCPRLRLPISFGIWRPTVLVPPWFCRRGAEEKLRWILVHELTHLERCDAWGCVLASLAQALYFYQPCFWWLRRQVRLCQEYVADAAAAALTSSEDYAEYLVSLSARSPQALPAGAGVTGVLGSPSDMFRRIAMLLEASRAVERRCPRWWSLTAGLGFTAIAVLISGLGLRAEEPETEKRIVVEATAGEAKDNVIVRTVPGEDDEDVDIVVHTAPDDKKGQHAFWTVTGDGKEGGFTFRAMPTDKAGVFSWQAVPTDKKGVWTWKADDKAKGTFSFQAVPTDKPGMFTYKAVPTDQKGQYTFWRAGDGKNEGQYIFRALTDDKEKGNITIQAVPSDKNKGAFVFRGLVDDEKGKKEVKEKKEERKVIVITEDTPPEKIKALLKELGGEGQKTIELIIGDGKDGDKKARAVIGGKVLDRKDLPGLKEKQVELEKALKEKHAAMEKAAKALTKDKVAEHEKAFKAQTDVGQALRALAALEDGKGADLDKLREALKKAQEAAGEKGLADVRKQLEEAMKRVEEAQKKSEGANKEAREKALKARGDALKKLEGMEGMKKLEGFKLEGVKGLEGLKGLENLKFGSGGGRLGIGISAVSEEVLAHIDLGKDQGIMVNNVVPDSAADKAGIKEHDIIVEFNGKAVRGNPQAFVELVSAVKADETVSAVVLRKGKKVPIKSIKLGEKSAQKLDGGKFFIEGKDFVQPKTPATPATPKIPARVIKPDGGTKKSVTVTNTRDNDNFNVIYKGDDLSIAITGTVKDGKPEASSITINGTKYEDFRKVPEQYRDKVKELMAMSAKGSVKVEVKD